MVHPLWLAVFAPATGALTHREVDTSMQARGKSRASSNFRNSLSSCSREPPRSRLKQPGHCLNLCERLQALEYMCGNQPIRNGRLVPAHGTWSKNCG